VHSYPGLRVSDGSIVPTAIGVNPSETIAALAEHNVEQLIADGGPART
jgi:choline dehydrogenase-like flavoprotein